MKGIVKSLIGSTLVASIILCCAINVSAEDYELIMDDSSQPAIAHREGEVGAEEVKIDLPETIMHSGDSVGINSDINHVMLNIYIDNSKTDTLEKWETSVSPWVNETYGNLMYNQLRYGGVTNKQDEETETTKSYNNYNLYFMRMGDFPSSNNNSNTNSNNESHSDDSNSNQAAVSEPVTQVATAAPSELIAVDPLYSQGITTTTSGTVVGPVNAAIVNYANLAAKLLVGPSAVVYKSATVSGNSKNVTLSVIGLANGQKVTVLAYDLATGTWKKISAIVKNGDVTFERNNSTIFSIVVDNMAP